MVGTEYLPFTKNEHIKKLEHVKLLEVKYPKKLYKLLKHTKIWYVLWQRYAYHEALNSGVSFDVVHVYSLSDYRRIGIWYKMKNAQTILGPVGGGQSCPKSLIVYDNFSHIYRDVINIYCRYSIFFKRKVSLYKQCYACNYETAAFLPNAAILPDVPLNDRLRSLSVKRKEHEKVVLLYCGRLINKKGLMLLLDIASKIPEMYNYELLIYGEGNQKNALQYRIHELGLGKRVFLKGFVSYDEMSNVYARADVFVLPSLRESGGSVLVEAMAHGLPIVSLNMALSRILSDYDVGLFVDINGSKESIINEFATNLVTLIENRTLRVTLGTNGYNYVNSKLTWDEMINQVYGNYLKSFSSNK